MPKNTWWIASLLTALVLLAGSVFYARQQKTAVEEARGALAELKRISEESAAQAQRLLGGLEESKERIEALQKERDEATQAQKSMESEMRAALQSKDVTISQLQGKLTVNILDRILFDSGFAELKPGGEAVLQQIAGVLAQYPNRQIHVIGHTDNVPIRANPRNLHATNWELSTARATAAVRYLSEKAGVDPRRLGALGYGEFQPIADNATPEGRSKNRRIALVVLPEVFAPTDLLPVPAATNNTNTVTEPPKPANPE